MRKDEDNKYNPSLPSSLASSDIALSDCLSESEDVDKEYTPPVKNPRKRRRRSATPEPEVPIHSDRRSTRLRHRSQASQSIADDASDVVESDDQSDEDAFEPPGGDASDSEDGSDV